MPEGNREPRQYSFVLLLLIFVVLTAGIVGAGYFYYANYRNYFRTQVEETLSAIADLKKDELAGWRAEMLRSAEILFRNPAFSILVQRALEQPYPPGAMGRLKTWLSGIKSAYDYDRLFFLDAQGRERAAAPDVPEAVAPHLKEALPEVLRSERIAFLDFHRDSTGGPIHLSILVPVLTDDAPRRALGVLVFRIDPKRYIYPVIARWPVPSRTAETLIVRREGEDVVFLNDLRFRPGSALELRAPLSNTSWPAVQAVLGHEGVVEGIDYRGDPVIAALRAVPGSPWFLIARLDTAEAFAPLRERLSGVVLFLGALLLAAAAAVGLLWRDQKARFYRANYEAEAALHALTRRQEALLVAAPDIILEVDDRKIYTWANRAAFEFFGEDVLGKEAAFYFEGEQETYETVRPLFDGQEDTIYVESWQRRRDGEKRLLAWWCRMLKDATGRVTGALSTARDITEQKRAEEALRESEAKLKIVFDDSVFGKSITLVSGEISVNRALGEMLGYSREELGRRKWQEITHPDDRELTQRQVDHLLSGEKESVRFVKRYLRKDGSVVWADVGTTLHRGPDGKPQYFITSVSDITEQKRAEHALVIQNRISDVFLTSPGEDIYSEVLKVALEVMESPFGLFGYIDKDGALVVPSVMGDVWDESQGPQKSMTFPRDTWGDDIGARAIREKKPNYSNEISASIPLGHVPIKRHISFPILYEGNVIGLFQVANKESGYSEEDIRKLGSIANYVAPILSARLLRQRHEDELRAKNDELIRFTYTVSHDLKSPLVTIRTFVGYLQQDALKGDAAAVDRDLSYIQTAAGMMSRLLDELLELSRIGRKVNPPVEVPLQEVVKEALELVAGRLSVRGVRTEVTEEPVLLYGDRLRLVEVFQNLIDNAVKFMGDQRTPLVEVGAERVDGEIVLFVRDNGIGIDPRHQQKLFNLFEQLDPGSEGTGIGLALVRRIIEVHGGRIWVESSGPGQGATFRFTLARTRQQPA